MPGQALLDWARGALPGQGVGSEVAAEKLPARGFPVERAQWQDEARAHLLYFFDRHPPHNLVASLVKENSPRAGVNAGALAAT